MKSVTLTLFLVVTCVFSAATDRGQRKQKDYPLALEIFETKSVKSAHDLAIVKASDGILYTISCPDSGGGLVGILTDPHCSDVTLIPGAVYRARWNRGDLKILESTNEHSTANGREATFTVIQARKLTTEEQHDCKVCVQDPRPKKSSPVTPLQNTPPQITATESGDSVDAAVSDFHAWKTKSECDEHLTYQQCIAQVEQGIPILQRLTLEWKKVKSELEASSDDPRSSQGCRLTVSNVISRFDEYLSLQARLVSMYESVDPDAPDAKTKWEMANAQYHELQQEEQSNLGDLEALYAHLKQDCPTD